MERVRVLIPADAIAERVREIGGDVSRDARGEGLVVVCVLKGAFVFCADLVRHIRLPLSVDFMRCSSYGGATETSGRVRFDLEPETDLRGRDVLVVEDIIDTGATARAVLDRLARRGPARVRLAALLSKPSRRRTDAPIDHVGFEVEDRFVVGYGLDHGERFRGLPHIGTPVP